MLRKYVYEGALIVFSVLFALFITKTYEQYQTNQKKKIAEASILRELYRNQSILKVWKENHSEVRDRISEVVNGDADSLRQAMMGFEYLNLGLLTNDESLVNAILINTAWESAKTTGIITEFDYSIIQQLTLVCNMQEMLMDRTLMEILDYYFDAESHDIRKLDQVLRQFQLRFVELTGQEELMTVLYSEAIETLQK
ncbi:MAG: hypothetical protein AAGA85_01225 [Bacteroidota bacterium]